MRQLIVNAEANGYQLNKRFFVEKRLVGHGQGMIGIVDLIRDLPRPILLKVDIDGGEANLLESAEGCKYLQDLRWVIETHSKELEGQCIHWLRFHGYDTRIIRNAFWRCILPEQRPLAHNRWLVAGPNFLKEETHTLSCARDRC